MTAKLVLKPGRDKAVLRGHPWIFSGAVDHTPEKVSPGATVLVESGDGQPLAWAAFSPHSQIRARVWSNDLTRPIDHAFFKRRIADAIALRCAQGLWPIASGGVRLVHGESDGLPGVTCDVYARAGSTDPIQLWLVLQLTSAGADKWRGAIADALCSAAGTDHLIERSDSDVRGLEGLSPRTGVLRGAAPPADFAITENALQLRIELLTGHKTGFYLDQRFNRAAVAGLANGQRVLNCFCYTGGFSLAALAGGASRVVSIDSSADALALARESLALNPLDEKRAEWRCTDAFEAMRALHREDQRFDLIIVDPPKLAPSAAHLDRAARAYKDLNLSAFRLLAPGGTLFTFSCSGAVSTDLFHKIVAGAAADAKIDAVIEQRLVAGPDHPWRLTFPEGEYLKGLRLRRCV